VHSFFRLTADRRDPLFARLPYRSDAASLAQEADKELEALSVETIDESQFREIYVHLYQLHFRSTPRLRSPKKDPKTDLIFSRVYSWCVFNDADPATYITANMHGMTRWLDEKRKTNRKITFQPNMLSGPNAIRRYEIYVSMANRRKRGDVDGYDYRTVEGHRRAEFLLTEQEVARRYVAAAIAGSPCEWFDAIEETRERDLLDPEWEALYRWSRGKPLDDRSAHTVDSLICCYGKSGLRTELEAYRSLAAVYVARTYRADLPDVVGCDVFSWDALIELLMALPRRSSRPVDLSRVSGTLWGAACPN